MPRVYRRVSGASRLVAGRARPTGVCRLVPPGKQAKGTIALGRLHTRSISLEGLDGGEAVNEAFRQHAIQSIADVKRPAEMLLERFSIAGPAQVAHVPGSFNVPAGDIVRGELPDFMFPEEDPVAVICSTGYRSSLAASLLQRRGKRGVCVVRVGMAAWLEARLPPDSS